MSGITRVRGYTRTKSHSVVSTDPTEYEIIKRERVRKRTTNALEKEVTQLRDIVMMLAKELKELKGG